MFFTTYFLLTGLLGSLATGPSDTPPVPSGAVQSLKAARTLGAGATVTVRAVVLNGAELGGLRFVQDGESGLALYALPTRVPGFDELQAGDSVQVTGQLKNYQGLLEMDPISAVRKISSGRPLRPLKVPASGITAAFSEAHEGRLLEVTGLSRLTNSSGTPVDALSANTNYLLDGQTGALLRVTNSSSGPNGLINAGVPKGEQFDVRGILSQFSASGTGGYQLLPRLATDLVRGGGLARITAEPVPVNITAQGFTIEFSTSYPGDTRISYGPSSTELTSNRIDEALTTQHRIVLDGLEPGTTYYVQVSSRNMAGMASSAAVPVITGGHKSGRKK
ncbi:hypothetical protein GO988_12130 [Hymenobacter sp. HMF4947]|uniref:Fibronectin type-III domain-containing protein n=1 Tax=Hymenobacter ginkgonis TaxID=2682976 RepID=A0A7K1TFB6_9BACT|nr:hypothetical protein [Hymenobacter ginkgonis]MVN77075.1 hypothetical protein [Hymenobacter ginkgonis]